MEGRPPDQLVVVEPGEWRVQEALRGVAKAAGGRWNYDAQNRGAFPKEGPGVLPAPVRFVPDAVTRGVIDLVNTRFTDHPGSLANFDWPLTPADARAALDDFLAHRLANFGRFRSSTGPATPRCTASRTPSARHWSTAAPTTSRG